MAFYKNRWGEEIDPLLSEISVSLYGFDIYMAMNFAERERFEKSPEAEKIRAIHWEKGRREAAARRAKMTPEEIERHDTEMRLLELELEKAYRKVKEFDRRYGKPERARYSKHDARNKGGELND
jgi:hypothetical protein